MGYSCYTQILAYVLIENLCTWYKKKCYVNFCIAHTLMQKLNSSLFFMTNFVTRSAVLKRFTCKRKNIDV
jgi:hypothetical protein